MRVKRIVSSVCFLALLLICFVKTADILEAKAAREKYTAFFESDTNFDVIFFGSSHMYNGVLPQELWREYGITSYNWGYSNSTLAENYYLLKEVVNYTNPKVVVIDLYGITEYESFGNGKYRTDRIEQQHVQFDMLPFSQNKLEATLDIFDDYEYKEDFLFDFLLYHTRWDDLTQEDFEPDYSTEKGADLLTGWKSNTVDFVSEDETIEINSVCSEYIQPIIEFCNENDIEILFVYLPYASKSKAQKVSNSFYEFAESFGDFNYLNLLYTDVMNYNTDLSTDGKHLNYIGEYKVTDILGEYLQQTYALEDYREDEAYASWWEDYEEYWNYKNNKMLKTDDLYRILILAYSDEYDIEVYDNGENLVDSDSFLSDYFDEKECTIYRDSLDVVDGDNEYKMILRISKSDTEEEILKIGVINSGMDFDVLE